MKEMHTNEIKHTQSGVPVPWSHIVCVLWSTDTVRFPVGADEKFVALVGRTPRKGCGTKWLTFPIRNIWRYRGNYASAYPW